MSDCPNVEIRELLPDYLGGTLAAHRRVEVEGHVAGCQDCQEEMAVLRLVREAYAGSPSVNVGAIVAALPRPSVKPVMKPATRTWRRSYALQIAAAVSFVALGGLSLTVARSFLNGNGAVGPVDSLVAVTTTAIANESEPAISFAGGVSDLVDEELEALLSALESIEALPVTEPAELPISTGRQGS
jgi:anti-sigma factor RsiW